MIKRTIFLLPLLMFFCMNSMAQYVTLSGKQFRLNGENFYPIRMCYVVNMGFNGADFFIAPHVHYNANYLDFDCTDESTCTAKLQSNFNYIAGMGFNTLKITGLRPIYISGQYLAFEYYKPKSEWKVNYMPINPSDPSDPGMLTLLSFYDKILEVANAATVADVPHPLKVVFTMTGASALREPEMALWNDYLATVSSYLKTSQYSTALFAYNLMSEPGYNDSLSSKTKQEACEIVSTWYDIVKANDPYHLVTFGSLGMGDIWSFDPSILKIDFNTLHSYPSFKPFENRTKPFIQDWARKRIASELYWLNQASMTPWMVGETGFTACDTCQIRYGVDGTLNDQGDYALFSLDATCNCGGSGYSWWQYQEVGWGSPGQNNLGLLKRRYDPCPEAEKQPTVNYFRNYAQNLPPQSAGICPVEYSSTFDESKIYYNPYQYTAPENSKITRIIKDQDGKPIKDAVVCVWTAIGLDTITKYMVNGVERDTLYTKQRRDVYYTHTDTNGYFKAIPSPQYGFDPPQNYTPKIVGIRVSAAGASEFYVWNKDGVAQAIPSPIPLNKINYDVTVNGVTISNGQTKSYKGRNSLTVSNTTIQSGGKATFTSARVVELRPGFTAQAGSRVNVYIDNTPPCDEFSFQQQRENILQPVKSGSLTTKRFELTFETDVSANYISVFPNPTNSTATIQLHSNKSDVSLKSIKLMDILGRVIQSKQVSGQSHILDISTCPQGIYFLETKDETNIYHNKIIIQ